MKHFIIYLLGILTAAAAALISGAIGAAKGTNPVTAVSAGAEHAAVLKQNGEVWVMGRTVENEAGSALPANVPVKVMDDAAFVDCGKELTAVITRGGTLWAWGRGTGGNEAEPKKLMDRAKTVSCGTGVVAAVNEDGELLIFTVGENGFEAPEKMLEDAVSVSCGENHICAIRSDGTLWSFGRNDHGQLGDGTYSDSTVPVEACGLINGKR
ncbi:MAG: hypothetical protein IJM18_08750 [Clostridia bacterium]|nr:hypothetical protein [Clostridia bacterium]